MLKLIYPEERLISELEVFRWAIDYLTDSLDVDPIDFDNNKEYKQFIIGIEEALDELKQNKPESLKLAIEIIVDSGQGEFDLGKKRFLNTSFDYPLRKKMAIVEIYKDKETESYYAEIGNLYFNEFAIDNSGWGALIKLAKIMKDKGYLD